MGLNVSQLNGNSFTSSLIGAYTTNIYSNSYIKKLYNKLDKMNKSTLLTIIQERNIGYTFTEDDSKSDIVQSLLEYFKLKYECWIIYKYFLDFCANQIANDSKIKKKCECKIILYNRFIDNLPYCFSKNLDENKLKKKMIHNDYKNLSNLEIKLLIGNNYISIINELYSKFTLLCNEDFVEKNNVKKKIYLEKPLSFKELKKIYNHSYSIFYEKIIKNELNRVINC